MMKKLLFAGATALTLLATAAPASAHTYYYRDQWGRLHHRSDHRGNGAIVSGVIGALVGGAVSNGYGYSPYGYGYSSQGYAYGYPSYGYSPYSSGYSYPSYGYSRSYSYPSYG